MAKYTYLLFNLAVVLPVIFLSIKFDVKPYKRPLRLLLIALFVSLPFIIWDIWAAREGHWLFNEKYILDFRLYDIPIEEMLFFFTVPYAMIYVWDVIAKYFKDIPLSNKNIIRSFIIVGFSMLSVALIVYWRAGYTRSVVLASLGTLVLSSLSGLMHRKRFWIFQALHMGLFFITNTFLTALPVISYGDSSYIGLRIGSIPIEDFLFSMCLITLAIIAYDNKLTNNT